MNVAALIAQAARSFPDATAISWIDRPLWTYAELAARAGALAGGLRHLGFQPGDRIIIAMSNHPTFYETLLGAWFAGLTPSPQNCRLHPAEIGYAADDCAARACFSTPDLTEHLRDHLPAGCALIDVDSSAYARLFGHGVLGIEPRAPEDPALLFYTGGTTSKPKAAIHTNRTLTTMIVSFLADSGTTVDDHLLHLAPLSHASGFLGLAYLARGRNNVILPTGALDAVTLGLALAAFPPLSFFAVPTVVCRLMEPSLLDPSLILQIRRIFFGGAPMYVEDLKQALEVFGPDRLWHLYGQGESPNTITYMPPRLYGEVNAPNYQARLASVGIARSGVLLRVAREDGAEAAPGEIGEVLVQGDTLMSGYWNRPEATAEALRDGWLHTGDLGSMDECGFLTLVDRSKDMIISGGSNIYPREIEEVLLTHPDVAECAVIGAPDREWGEIPIAFVVAPQRRPAPEDLDALCLGQLARYKRPKIYRFLDDLPKSPYGKILKRELRDLIATETTS